MRGSKVTEQERNKINNRVKLWKALVIAGMRSKYPGDAAVNATTILAHYDSMFGGVVDWNIDEA